MVEVEELLAGSLLGDLPIGYGPGRTIMVQDVPRDRLLPAWQAAHDLLQATGRWPLLVTDWSGGGSLLMSSDPTPGPTEEALAALDLAARTVDPWPLIVGEGRPVPDRVVPDAAAPATGSRDAGFVVRTDHWFVPDNVSLFLLPTEVPWLAAAWTHYHGTQGKPQELLAAVFRQWHQRCDARLVACWDTMLQFTVHRPPAPGPDAWELAGQIAALARSLQVSRDELAAVLPDGAAWFLHDRP